MEPISSTDRLARILRQKLLDRARTTRGGAAKAASGLEVAKAIAIDGSPDDRQVRRALVEGILVEQFGERVLNEAKFQQVVEDVAKTLEEDAQSADLVTQVLRSLRSQTA